MGISFVDCESDPGTLVRRPLDLDRMRRAVDVLDRRVALDRGLDRDLLDRMRCVLGRAQREQQFGQSLCLAADLAVTQRDRSLGPGGTGKTLVLNMPVPIHSSSAGSSLRRMYPS